MPNSIFAGAPTQTPLPHTYQLYLRGPTSEEKEGKERRRERGGQEEKGEDRKREGKGFAGPMCNCFLRACYGSDMTVT